MVKRKAAGRFKRRVKAKIRRQMAKKRRLAATPTASRGRIQEVTPPSTGRKAFHAIRDFGAGMVSNALGPEAGFGVELAGKGMEIAYDYLTAKGPRKSYGGTSGYVGGSSGNKKIVKFSRKKSRNPSIVQLQKRGISYRYESRKTAKTAGAEAVVIGHTSMPGKICAINMWRALLKHLLVKANVIIKDYGNLMVNEGFAAGDVFKINRYVEGTSTTVATDTFTVDGGSTYDSIAAQIADSYDNNSNMSDDRLDSIEFTPNTTSKINAVDLNLTSLKITVFTKSVLKVQNVTVEATADNEADDVNRVPLVGKSYLMRGNNFVRKSNQNMLNGLFYQYNEDVLYGGYARQQPSLIANTTVPFYQSAAGPANSDQTTFFKPSEPPKQYELSNCMGMGSCVLNPGEIKSSTLVQKYTFGFQYYFNLIYGKRNTNNALIIYNPQQGKSAYFYLEKAVGRKSTESNDINLWVELDFEQSALCHGAASTFTMPIQFQQDFD